MADEVIRLVKLTRPEFGHYITDDVGMVMEEAKLHMEEDIPGEQLIIETMDMSRAEYDALPEFTGW